MLYRMIFFRSLFLVLFCLVFISLVAFWGYFSTETEAVSEIGTREPFPLPTGKQLARAIEFSPLSEETSEYFDGQEGSHAQSSQAVQKLYKNLGFSPVWHQRPGAFHRFIQSLSQVHRHGLNPHNYHLARILAQYRKIPHPHSLDPVSYAMEVARLDILTTGALLRYGSHLLWGVTESRWDVNRENEHLPDLLMEALQENRLSELLNSLPPRHPGYMGLQNALEHHRQLAEAGGWPKVSTSEMSPAQRQAQVVKRLIASGDLDPRWSVHPDVEEEEAFSDALDEAVRRFQKRHGLLVDGIVGKQTIGAMNVAVEARIRQIELNLERWRWLPRDLGSRHVMVNVPDFTVTAYEDGRPISRMAAMVGTEYRETPIFADQITYMAFNPFWNIPRNTAVREMLPKIRQDPSYLSRNGIEVLHGGRLVDPAEIDWSEVTGSNFPYRLRQLPGPRNPMARVKFMFPNQYLVYLHDTPSGHLFKRPRRAYSRGCVRIARPLELAEWLLDGDSGWDRDRIQEVLDSGSKRDVSLKDPVPVYILYWTAWVDDEGILQFRSSLYGRDDRLAEELPAGFLSSAMSRQYPSMQPDERISE